MASTQHIPAIDGLRAFAVLSVIIFHADFLKALPGGFTGVDIFFVISGYVISQSLSARANLSFVAYLADFYRRRFLRIVPALLSMLLACGMLSAMFVPQAWLSAQNDRTRLAAFFGLSNFVLAWNTDTYFSPSTQLNPYTHTWTLAVEEQFYLVFPLIHFLWLRYRERSKLVWTLLPLLAQVSLAYSAFETRDHPHEAFYLLPSRFWELAAGAILFQMIATGRLAPTSPFVSQVALLGGLALVTSGLFLADERQFPFPWALITVSGTLLIIAAVAQETAPSSRLLRLLQSSPATYIGRLSYSLYLWHWPVLVLLRWTTGLELLVVQLAYPVIVMALAAASYHWVETPLRTGDSMFQRRAWITITSGLCALALSWSGARWVSENPEAVSLSQTRDAYTWFSRRLPQRPASESINDSPLQGRQLFVFGDSHAAAYRTMLSLASRQLGIRVVEYERGGCPVASLIAPDPQGACAPAREKALRDIEARAKPGDIVFLASLRMPELAGREWARGEETVFNDVLAELTPGKMEEARISAETVLRRLMAAEVRVLINAPMPLFKAPPYRCSDWFNRMNPICTPGFTITRDRLDQLRAAQMALLDRLARQYSMLRIWDPLPLLCPGPTCSAYRDDKPIFRDGDHLSGHGNRLLAPSFMKALLNG
ncbi:MULTISPECIES: acyltransferase family protein [unclassified Pseudomonas]|uniref:acyltransferase family protein n=1 Tax=unclassified Pseudomonas TaxID=196821 RepID=UPI000876BA0A|nr:MULTISPECIES: acyltransferase family protein [unclassified Pseudomonas]SCZ45596.1 Peptidoglycan/LPS O-acetylase OafA/YrhL, contains acyltransferase and SGNH-hydrolase domains [Pseudomonas sp. NFACC44-2]SDA57524.1 Peptidoglycan/LPS O-acetylase OafA/YrhL, contains acyltransferase and SGNH-hydrolase domains [Pseudomonas sp. NFACC51]SFJ01313.1 Peptidoglycan/LPS O-acetylase OafA/YrhL, contains acyltransferase and SGNH-hydrolase domains [Pseudomonas sp. NFACC54]SFS66824.1 Peptidoglycan/LPS O-acety